jgi:hypothetical protein
VGGGWRVEVVVMGWGGGVWLGDWGVEVAVKGW